MKRWWAAVGGGLVGEGGERRGGVFFQSGVEGSKGGWVYGICLFDLFLSAILRDTKYSKCYEENSLPHFLSPLHFPLFLKLSRIKPLLPPI